MKVVSVISQKGGVGKTTLSTALAVEASRNNHETVLFDLDPQASATFWNDSRSEETSPIVTAIPPSRLEHCLKAANNEGADFIFIDTPPFSKDIAYEAARFADLVLIPTKPAILDIIAMNRTVDLIKSFSKQASVVLTFCPPVGKEIEESREAIHQLGVQFCPVSIGNRIAFSRAQQSGQVAQEYEAQGKASQEIIQLYEYICIQVGLS